MLRRFIRSAAVVLAALVLVVASAWAHKKCPSCQREFDKEEMVYCPFDGGKLVEVPVGGDKPAPARELIRYPKGSVVTVQIRNTDKQYPLTVTVLESTPNAVVLHWSAGDPPTSFGIRKLLRNDLAVSRRYSDVWTPEEVVTLQDACSVWFSQAVIASLQMSGMARLDLDSAGTVDCRRVPPPKAGLATASLTINGKAVTVPVMELTVGAGARATVLEDPGAPLVLNFTTGDYSAQVTALTGVELPGQPAPPGTEPPPAQPPAEPPIPDFDSPQSVFDAWKKAIDNRDRTPLADCYAAATRKALLQNSESLGALIEQYHDGVKKGKYTFTKQETGEAKAQWEWKVRIQEVFWNREVKQVIYFTKEGSSWRISQILNKL